MHWKRWAISIARTTTRRRPPSIFNRLAKAYPDDYVPYLALGDLYTQTKEFARADANYQQAYKLAPDNPVVIANAANAAIEAQQIKLAGEWVNRAKGKMNDDPRVMRERERYLFHEGNYAESAKLGYKVLQQLPKDRNASVYLAYDLYNLGRYDDALAVSDKYDSSPAEGAELPAARRPRSQALAAAGRGRGRLHARHSSAIRRWWKPMSIAATR